MHKQDLLKSDGDNVVIEGCIRISRKHTTYQEWTAEKSERLEANGVSRLPFRANNPVLKECYKFLRSKQKSKYIKMKIIKY